MSTLETGENFLGTAEKLLVDAAGEIGFTPGVVSQYKDEALEIFNQIAVAMNPNAPKIAMESKDATDPVQQAMREFSEATIGSAVEASPLDTVASNLNINNSEKGSSPVVG